MSDWASEPRPHPGGGTWFVPMPVAAPERHGAARKRRPVPGCEACAGEPCQRHGYDLRASFGATPAEAVSPDEYYQWEPVT